MNQQEIIYAHKQTIAKLRHENRDLKQCCEELQVINDKREDATIGWGTGLSRHSITVLTSTRK
jgi:hypothetical protein